LIVNAANVDLEGKALEEVFLKFCAVVEGDVTNEDVVFEGEIPLTPVEVVFLYCKSG